MPVYFSLRIGYTETRLEKLDTTPSLRIKPTISANQLPPFLAASTPYLWCWNFCTGWLPRYHPLLITALKSGDKLELMDRCVEMVRRRGARRPVKNDRRVPAGEHGLGPVRGRAGERNKKKVTSVMDFRELNAHIESHTADADSWKQRKAARIRIDKSLWPYQTTVFKDERYCLTRLGFSLNVAPLVMKAVNCVLSQDPQVRRGTSAYIDDILVNESVVGVDRVKRHLAHYGLTCKTQERAADGAHLLGLKRDNDVGGAPEELIRCSVFSYCGKLVGHFPVCGWLRIAAIYIKRRANDANVSWDEVIESEKAKVWVDASSLAVGVALENRRLNRGRRGETACSKISLWLLKAQLSSLDNGEASRGQYDVPNRCLHRRSFSHACLAVTALRTSPLAQGLIDKFIFANAHWSSSWSAFSFSTQCHKSASTKQATNCRSQDRRLPRGKLCLQGLDLLDQLANNLIH
ncbi:hypothetical protein T10_9280 [Trichinella papuae]|uniref:DUF7047 domain-containing protein n=1 Tax=Trichinella papuae TaxID=268474 RepID=A0A0V1MWW4_9BILA|nr:hypothetical protein T10_9280 [Trichinella papuae]